ncbi:MAG: HepT-like ribonuclease domain-containing protein [Limnothrix sp.]
MLAEIEVIESTINNLDMETFASNQQALRVILYGFAVIGEAIASAISELEMADPTMPWEQIRGMRNMVIHEYFRVDVAIIWETVQLDIPMLKRSLLKIQHDLTDGK